MSSSEKLMFAAVLVQVALTFIVYLFLVRARFGAAGDPAIDRNRIGFDQSAWPVKAQLLANSIASQFELPVLFYAAVLFYFHLGAADMITVSLAWIFALSRIVHAFIHTTTNIILQRFSAFAVGVGCVAVMWIWLAVKALGG